MHKIKIPISYVNLSTLSAASQSAFNPLRPQEPFFSAIMPVIKQELDKPSRDAFSGRRGWSKLQYCQACGWQARCPGCEGSNQTSRLQLHCHRRDYQLEPIIDCPACQQTELSSLAPGTQQICELAKPIGLIIHIVADTDMSRGEIKQSSLYLPTPGLLSLALK